MKLRTKLESVPIPREQNPQAETGNPGQTESVEDNRVTGCRGDLPYCAILAAVLLCSTALAEVTVNRTDPCSDVPKHMRY